MCFKLLCGSHVLNLFARPLSVLCIRILFARKSTLTPWRRVRMEVYTVLRGGGCFETNDFDVLREKLRLMFSSLLRILNL